ncbi:MAG: hypothetical protein ACE5F6_12190 [Anaerolineae bacterium]
MRKAGHRRWPALLVAGFAISDDEVPAGALRESVFVLDPAPAGCRGAF